MNAGAAVALPRVRQAVLAARDLDAVVARLRTALALAEPFSDPAVAYFGLRNAVFAIGDTFLEVVSPTRADSSAARLLARRERDCCGYMVMFQVADLAAARARAAALGVREVFAVDLEDMSEVHLHPRDIGGAIVSLSQPRPAASWRWGGPDWERRRAPLELGGVRVAVRDADGVAGRWRAVVGDLASVTITSDAQDPGLVEVVLAGSAAHEAVEFDGVRLVFV